MSGEAAFPYHVVTNIILAVVSIQVFIGRLQRPVRCGVRQECEERLAIANVAVYLGDHPVRVESRREEIFRQLPHQFPVFPVQRRIAVRVRTFHIGKVTTTTVQQRERLLEATTARRLLGLHAQMPFAGHISVIANRFQNLRDRFDTIIEVALVARQTQLIVGDRLGHVAEAGNMVIHSTDQHRTTDRARGPGVEVL